VAAIKREPMPPPGPIADLFYRLDDLHSKAGRPSMREIAIRAGRGNISSSTVHNLFRRPQGPRWAFREQVAKALGGVHQLEAFLTRWEAAWRAENDVAAPQRPPAEAPLPQSRSGGYPELSPRQGQGQLPGGMDGWIGAVPRPQHRIWSNEIPSRKANFTSPEPIAAELFLQPTDGIEGPPGLADFLALPTRFRAAATQLHRLSLARVDGAHDLIQVHRVVQAVTQGRLRLHRIEVFRAYRAAVESLLASSNPGNPDHGNTDQAYDLSLQHLASDYRFLRARNPELRALIIDQVRRLHLRGGHVEAAKFGQDALQVWRDRLGADDPQVLALSVEVAIAMYIGGRCRPRPRQAR